MKENTTKGQRKTNTLFAREHVLCSMTRCPPPDLLPFPLATVTAAAAAVLLALLAAALRMLLVRDDGAAWVRADLACERLLAAGLLLSALHAQALQLGPLQCLC